MGADAGRRTLKVACVYPPFTHHEFQENLKVVDEDFGRLTPLSLLYAAAIAEREGHEVRVLDANALRMSVKAAVSELSAWQPDVLAFSLNTYTLDDVLPWVRALKAALGVPTVVGGINVRLYPEETLAHPFVDFGVLHFGLRGFPALLRSIAEGRDPVGLPEVVARLSDTGPVVVGPVDLESDPYPELPLPARHLVDNRVYHSFISQRRSFTVMVTSTGCPFRCSFCAIASLPRFLNPVPRVLEEVRTCVEEHGIHEIDFFDADFFASRRRALAICEGIRELGLDLEWSCRARLDGLDDEVLQAARAAGCRQMYVGIETPDPVAIRRMHKPLHPNRVPDALSRMKLAGIRPLGFFMIGVPGETWASALATIRCALSLPLDYAQFSRTIAKPGSRLLDEVIACLGHDPWREHVLGRRLTGRLPTPWTSLGETEIDLLTKLGYVAFYYRPSYVLRALGRIRSLEELWRGLRTAARMVAGLASFDPATSPRESPGDPRGSSPGRGSSR